VKYFHYYLCRQLKGGGMEIFMQKREGMVLITGGTGGIGLALAKKFAKEGYDIVLTASGKERLIKAKILLKRINPHSRIELICQDLSVDGAAEQIYRKTVQKKLVIDILVNNAGIGLTGEAVMNERRKEEEMLRVNIQALTQLCGYFLKDMYKRGCGKVLNVASVGAFMPGPYTAAYYASKAYVASYSRALRYEAAGKGVQVCTLYPGTTRTQFFERAGSATPFWAMSPDRVAKAAYKGVMKNKEMIVPGIMNRCLRLIPVKWKLLGVALIKK